MASLENLTIEDLKTFAKARSIDSYENIFRQQLEGISTTLSIPKPTAKSTPKPFSKPKTYSYDSYKTQKHTPLPVLKPRKPVLALINTDDEFEKSEMAKSRSLSKNAWYE